MRILYCRKFAVKSLLVLAMVFTLGLAGSAGAKDENPCAMKNAKSNAASQNKPIRKEKIKDYDALVKKGVSLWTDASLGKSGISCSTCHPGGAGLKAEPFPKHIAMADDIITMDQMINFCMTNPMKAKPLQWNSIEMTALASYVKANAGAKAEVQNPCSMKNPCGVKNPCSMR
jgi:cytochrome c